jgi:hypothetical protein
LHKENLEKNALVEYSPSNLNKAAAYDDIVTYPAPTNYSQKLKLMREVEHFTYINTPPPSRAAPVGHKRGIGVSYNLF